MKSLVLVLVFLAWFVTPAIADFDAGMAAYQRGDYVTAFREFKPLSEKGAAQAQNILRVLNRELGAAGLAWWYRQYSKDESLGKLEAEARATRRGLWADRDPSRPGAGGSGRRGGSAEG